MGTSAHRDFLNTQPTIGSRVLEAAAAAAAAVAVAAAAFPSSSSKDKQKKADHNKRTA
ncbi:hypothetical protein VTG60DRAFT_1459 [Thermothelomyces hinnuleus]